MSDFFDHLWDQFHASPSQQHRSRYREYLKTLIEQSPPMRPLRPRSTQQAARAVQLDSLPESQSFQSGLAGYELFFLGLTAVECNPSCFRQAKDREPSRPFWRRDLLKDEVTVLETRAMGSDAYCLGMSELDQAATQFLVELGRDYQFPAVLCCQTEEELARALQIKDVQYYCLEGVLVAPQLLELEWFRGKTVLFALQNSDPSLKFHRLADPQLILIDRESKA